MCRNTHASVCTVCQIWVKPAEQKLFKSSNHVWGIE